MNLSESLALLKSRLDNIDQEVVIIEGKGHLDHPEDLVFLEDEPGVRRAIDAIVATVNNPNTVTIKWDGYPALIFGRGNDGKFTIMDKHMFNKKDGTGRQVYSPQEFVEYDNARGVNRGELYELINTIWPGLEKADRGSNGFYWGDLLFSRPLKENDGLYKFKANPNGIAYTVDADSEIGKLIAGKNAGIAVHQFISADAESTDDAVSLNGTIGNLQNNSNVAIVPSKMPVAPKLKVNTKLKNEAEQALSQYGNVVADLMNTAPQARNTFNQLFTVYINKRIVSGNLSNLLDGFIDFVQSRPMSDKMKAKILEHLEVNKEGVVGAFKIWVALYNLKMDVVKQLNKAAEASPVKGYLQDGTQTQEGFVSNGVKLVDRLGFSRQNLAGTR
jgi:hypothetical protein